ncbi:MAG: hypothetical protein M3R48_09285 [Candidatus Dormibacteraeota bacterium]|nr:hypothetical protein [Candidatus Dormibacteraeota bacterium]
MSPGTIVAALLVLIAAQATRLLMPRRVGYLPALAGAALGLLLGELIALSGHGGPALGVIHPVPDIVAIVAVEAAIAVMLPVRPTARR